MKEKVMNAIVKYRAVPVATGLMVVSSAFPALASESADVTTSVTSVVGMVTSVMTLLTQPPLVYFLAGGLALMAFKVFRGGKKAAN